MTEEDTGAPEQTQEEVDAQAAAEEQAAFALEFANESDGVPDTPDVDDTDVADITEDVESKEETDQASDESDQAEEPSLSEQMAEMRKTIRQMQGKNGELKARIQELGAKPADPVEAKKQLKELLDSDEELSELKEEFAEFHNGINRAAEITKQDILSEIVIPESMSEDEFNYRLDMRELNKAHKDWKTDVGTEEFYEYLYAEGPPIAEALRYEEAKRAKDPEAGIMMATFLEQYPEWADSKGRLYNSNQVSDAKEMLDQYKEHRAAPAKKAKAKRDRLSMNTAATKSSSEGEARRDQTAHEAFLEGFK